MSRADCTLLVSLAFVLVPAVGWSKGETTKIEIRGDKLASPIEITDPQVVGRFSIWNGPGVSTSSAGKEDPPAWADPTKAEGRFIDWPSGWATDRPSGLQRLEVTLYIGGTVMRDGARNFATADKYVFLYEVDAARRRGYVYLPRWKNELILNFVEGNWLYAAKAWDELMIPLISKNSQTDSASAGQGDLPCALGTGSITPDGTLELHLLDDRDKELGTFRFQLTDSQYASIRDLMGSVVRDQGTRISCWPKRS